MNEVVEAVSAGLDKLMADVASSNARRGWPTPSEAEALNEEARLTPTRNFNVLGNAGVSAEREHFAGPLRRMGIGEDVIQRTMDSLPWLRYWPEPDKDNQ